MKRLSLILLALFVVSCGPTITPSTQDELRLIAEQGEVRLEAVAPMLWARVALKGEVSSIYCEKPNCEPEEGVVYLALPPKQSPYALRTPVASYTALEGGAAIATLEGYSESFTAQLERW
jgi:hypothetical protein